VRSVTPNRVIIAVVSALTAVFVLVAIWIGAVAVLQPGCNRCHLTGEFKTATTASPHAEVTCVSCHGGGTAEARLGFAASQVGGMYLKVVDLDPAVAAVPSARCRGCHEDQMSGLVENNGLRIKHESCMIKRECTDCHSPTAHGAATSWPKTVTMDMCYDCHGSGTVSAKCDMCHTAKLPSDRVKTGTFSITHGPNHAQTHGMADTSTCQQCHESTKCEKCHGGGVPHTADFVRTHGGAATGANAQCTSCHAKRFCIDCHKYPMPHPKSFKKEHGRIVERADDVACKRCHDPLDCTSCHVKHVHPTTLEQLKALGVNTPEAGAK